MPYIYEGDEPTRVNGVRYAPGSVAETDDVKGKKGFREASDDEVEEHASKRPGTFADAKQDAWEGKFAEATKWVGQATVAAPLNKVVGDNEAPYGPPTGTITTKQAVMRDASSSMERHAFGDHEWLPEDAEKRNLAESTSGKVQALQAEESGQIESVTEDLLDDGGDDADSSASAEQSAPKPKSKQSSSVSTPSSA